MSKDPYLYEDINILKNIPNIKDQKNLMIMKQQW